jgi:alpha-tubulin suppressor-like RCC1 family protein
LGSRWTGGWPPVRLGWDNDWKDIAGGRHHSLAIKKDGSLWAKGSNLYGQLGDGTTTNQVSFIRIGSDKNWAVISAGGGFSLAIKTDGSLWSWGLNSYGELGDGPFGEGRDGLTIRRLSPGRIGTDNNWKTVSAGSGNALGIKTDGSLWGWGRNWFWQLGIGSREDQPRPVRIGSDNDWIAVSAGEQHTLALKTDGSLWAWGRNNRGQLGDGTTVDKNVPVRIMNGVVAISAGGGHTTAIKTDGSLCNSLGQIGDGTTIDRLTPVRIGTASDRWSSENRWHSLGLGNR